MSKKEFSYVPEDLMEKYEEGFKEEYKIGFNQVQQIYAEELEYMQRRIIERVMFKKELFNKNELLYF